MVGPHVENDRIIGRIAHEALVAFIRLKHEIFPSAGPVVSGEAAAPEPLDQRPVKAGGIGPEIGQRLGKIRGHRALAAAAGHRDGAVEMRFADHPFEQFGTVKPGNPLPREKIRIVLLDRRGVDQKIRPGGAHAGAVLRIDRDSLQFERVDNPPVLRAVRPAVTAGNPIAAVGAHGGQSAHADAADADKMQMNHRPPLSETKENPFRPVRRKRAVLMVSASLFFPCRLPAMPDPAECSNDAVPASWSL